MSVTVGESLYVCNVLILRGNDRREGREANVIEIQMNEDFSFSSKFHVRILEGKEARSKVCRCLEERKMVHLNFYLKINRYKHVSFTPWTVRNFSVPDSKFFSLAYTSL